jgi:hypothetical protein
MFLLWRECECTKDPAKTIFQEWAREGKGMRRKALPRGGRAGHDLLRKILLGDLGESGEGLLVCDGQFREDLPIDVHAGLVEAVDKIAV